MNIVLESNSVNIFIYKYEIHVPLFHQIQFRNKKVKKLTPGVPELLTGKFV